ncbi:hypothetical protein CBR_g18642 [Chara braunii]|uniref:NLE domain-containing protein n=1 Tax=Chara braunii TaxID=69332 RepID=A0A388JTA0_CHABU|nr:hypothetical protein CBR_g18642 [Chara braunii]|eukprot:GBG61049.1 hypothetical protein CBR_g18642 [Chara braunii]
MLVDMAASVDGRSPSSGGGMYVDNYDYNNNDQGGQPRSWQGEEERQVQVRFTTSLPPKFRVTNAPFAVPGHLTRYGLSEVINTLLQLEKTIPFDFLVDGELVRGSLEKLLVARKLSAETILTIEYIPAVVPPHKEQSVLHDDWISALSGSLPRCIMTGSYDGTGRLCDTSGVCLATLTGHSDAITSIAALPPPRLQEGGEAIMQQQIATASKDRTIKLWHLCSGSWDCTIKVWNADTEPDVPVDEDGLSTKRRKASDGEAVSADGQLKQVSAIATLAGHTQCVAAVAWSDPQTIYSGSWDHSIRSWDVETHTNMLILTGSKAVHCLSVQDDDASSLIATGGSDNVLRIWDPRASDTAAPVMQLSSHKNWITAVKWSTKSENLLLSASHDNTVKIWDRRSKIPLHTVTDHNDKLD